MTFKTFGISGFRIFAYTFILMPTTSLKRTVSNQASNGTDPQTVWSRLWPLQAVPIGGWNRSVLVWAARRRWGEPQLNYEGGRQVSF